MPFSYMQVGKESEGKLQSFFLAVSISYIRIESQLMPKVLKVQYEDLPKHKGNPGTAYCRELLKDGEKPNTRLECYRGERLDITFPHIGNAAKWYVYESDETGLSYQKYKEFPEKLKKGRPSIPDRRGVDCTRSAP